MEGNLNEADWVILLSKLLQLERQSSVTITAANNTTINGYQVPSLTTEQVHEAYNAVMAGRAVTIIDATGSMAFQGINADVISNEVFVSFRYFDVMILDYDENGSIAFKEL